MSIFCMYQLNHWWFGVTKICDPYESVLTIQLWWQFRSISSTTVMPESGSQRVKVGVTCSLLTPQHPVSDIFLPFCSSWA